MIKFEVFQDWRENPKKCTVLPVRNHHRINMIRLRPEQEPVVCHGQVFLHVDGVDVSSVEHASLRCELSEGCTVTVIDSIWTRVPKIEAKMTQKPELLVKLPDTIRTAYPRKNKAGEDPQGGLATIEAMFAIAALLGDVDPTLLEKYHFAPQFLDLNKTIFSKWANE